MSVAGKGHGHTDCPQTKTPPSEQTEAAGSPGRTPPPLQGGGGAPSIDCFVCVVVSVYNTSAFLCVCTYVRTGVRVCARVGGTGAQAGALLRAPCSAGSGGRVQAQGGLCAPPAPRVQGGCGERRGRVLGAAAPRPAAHALTQDPPACTSRELSRSFGFWQTRRPVW